jgi:nitronate monooxygenase
MRAIADRIASFCGRFHLRAPILLAPMAGACPPSLSIAIANAGGMGAAGVLLMQPGDIDAWVREFRAASSGALQLNSWIPDPPPKRDLVHETEVAEFLAAWGPQVPDRAADAVPPDFASQCDAMLASGAPVISSIMGLYPSEFVARMQAQGSAWFANVTTVSEARAAAAAGADVIVAQGAEAGGHRGCFDAAYAEQRQVGLFALLPAVVDAVDIPVVAAGGIADVRGIAAAFLLGASAVQIGTGFLRCPEAKLPAAWANALAHTAPEDTVVTRVFSGRAGRSIANDYVRAAMSPSAPEPAPHPVQRGLTAVMRAEARNDPDVRRMQAWAGQSAALAPAMPAGELVEKWWVGVKELLSLPPT